MSTTSPMSPALVALLAGALASVGASARAGEPDPAACSDEVILERLNACMEEANAYTHGAWRLFRANVCRATYEAPAVVERTFCYLEQMGVDPSALSFDETGTATVEGSVDGRAVLVTLSMPAEDFAVDAGYELKAEIQIDGAPKSVVWWSGSEPDATRGYMIEGPIPLETGGDLETAIYIRWDRTSPLQDVEYVYGSWGAGGHWLQDDGAGNVDLSISGLYGAMLLDVDTGLVPDLQVVRLGRQLGGEEEADPPPAPLSCYRQRMYGQIQGGYVYTFNNGERDEPYWTDVDKIPGEGNDMTLMGDGELLLDDPAYPNGQREGTASDFVTDVVDPDTGEVIAEGPGDFAWSCDDVYTTSLFSVPDAVVDFTATPDTVFGSM